MLQYHSWPLFQVNTCYFIRQFHTTHLSSLAEITTKMRDALSWLCAKFQPNPFSSFGGDASQTDRHTDRYKHKQTDTHTNNKLSIPALPWERQQKEWWNLLCICYADVLKGQVAWITGASSGIGKHLAYQLARVGCKLVLSARSTTELENVRKDCLSLYSCTMA